MQPIGEAALTHVFRPIRVGTLSLDHRIVVPPHGGGNGNLLGSTAEFEQHFAMWLAKAHGGIQWLGGGPNFVRNPLPGRLRTDRRRLRMAPGFLPRPALSAASASSPDGLHAAGRRI